MSLIKRIEKLEATDNPEPEDTGAAWQPLPGPQTEAYQSPAFEVLYGGQAGGGKSDLLLGLARSEHRRAVIFRRIYPDLEHSIIPRSKEFYGDIDGYNEAKHRWSIGGRVIWFSHLEGESDKFSHQSAAYDYIGFDELTQFTETQYLYLLSRARTTAPGQRVRVVSATNPGGEGNDWVMRRWAPWLDETYPEPAKPGELRYFKRLDDGRDVETTPDDPMGKSRTFIPASLEDNPYLGEDYRATLNLLPEPFRSQLMRGDWKAGMVDDAYQVIPRAWVKAAMDRWEERSDPGKPETIGADIARGGDDKTVFARLYYGDWFAQLEKIPGRETPTGQAAAGLLALALSRGGVANVDVIGIGASAYDVATERGLNVIPVNFAERSEETDSSGQLHFVNQRAACWWRLREALDPESGRFMSLPPDPELFGDLIAPRWQMTTSGIKIEDKDNIKKRIGRSPDCGDALALALYNGRTGGVLEYGYNPLEDYRG